MKDDKDANEDRFIHVTGNFNENVVQRVSDRLFNLEAKDPTKDIALIINSYGGYVHGLLAIHDIINHVLVSNVATICVGKAMSAGALLLLSGTKGKRFITPNARVMLHELSTVTWGKITEAEIHVEESRQLQKLLDNVICKQTNITRSDLKQWVAADQFYDAKTALELGLVDHVVRSSRTLYKHIRI